MTDLSKRALDKLDHKTADRLNKEADTQSRAEITQRMPIVSKTGGEFGRYEIKDGRSLIPNCELITNAAVGIGQPVVLKGQLVDQMRKRRKDEVEEAAAVVRKKIKYVYFVLESGSYNCYVGGWKSKPVKVFSLTPAQYNAIGYCTIDNLGGDNYSINISYQDKVQYWKNGQLKWSVTTALVDPDNNFPFYEPRGHGFWSGASLFFDSDGVYYYKQQNWYIWEGVEASSDIYQASSLVGGYSSSFSSSSAPGTLSKTGRLNSKDWVLPNVLMPTSTRTDDLTATATNVFDTIYTLSSETTQSSLTFLSSFSFSSFNSARIRQDGKVTLRYHKTISLQIVTSGINSPTAIGSGQAVEYRQLITPTQVFNYYPNDVSNQAGYELNYSRNQAYAGPVTPMHSVPDYRSAENANFPNAIGESGYMINMILDSAFYAIKTALSPSQAIAQSKSLAEFSIKKYSYQFSQQGNATKVNAYLPHVKARFSIYDYSYHPS